MARVGHKSRHAGDQLFNCHFTGNNNVVHDDFVMRHRSDNYECIGLRSDGTTLGKRLRVDGTAMTLYSGTDESKKFSADTAAASVDVVGMDFNVSTYDSGGGGGFVQVVITSSNNKFKYSRYNVVGTTTTSYSATRTLISGTYSGSGFATHLQTKINESGNVIVAYDAVSNKLVFKANETFGQLTIEDSGTTCHSEIGMAAGAGNITVSASSTGDGTGTSMPLTVNGASPFRKFSVDLANAEVEVSGMNFRCGMIVSDVASTRWNGLLVPNAEGTVLETTKAFARTSLGLGSQADLLSVYSLGTASRQNYNAEGRTFLYDGDQFGASGLHGGALVDQRHDGHLYCDFDIVITTANNLVTFYSYDRYITPGTYTPRTLAAHLNTLLVAVNDYETVTTTYNPSTNKFTFTAERGGSGHFGGITSSATALEVLGFEASTQYSFNQVASSNDAGYGVGIDHLTAPNTVNSAAGSPTSAKVPDLDVLDHNQTKLLIQTSVTDRFESSTYKNQGTLYLEPKFTVDDSNKTLVFNGVTSTLTVGTYTPRSLMAHLNTKLTNVGASSSAVTVSHDVDANKFIFSGNFSSVGPCSAYKLLGFNLAQETAAFNPTQTNPTSSIVFTAPNTVNYIGAGAEVANDSIPMYQATRNLIDSKLETDRPLSGFLQVGTAAGQLEGISSEIWNNYYNNSTDTKRMTMDSDKMGIIRIEKGGAPVFTCGVNQNDGGVIQIRPTDFGDLSSTHPRRIQIVMQCRRLAPNSAGTYYFKMDKGTTTMITLDAKHGNISCAGTFPTSDDRLKFFESSIENALDVIEQLHPQTYIKVFDIANEEENSHLTVDELLEQEGARHESGFIAQEVRQIPELAHMVKESTTDDEGHVSPLGLNYTDLHAWTIAAVQELHQIVKDQAETIDSLNERILSLEANM